MNTDKTNEMASVQPENVRITIDPKYKLDKVASKDATRPGIQVIKLDATTRFGQCAVATNGKSLAIVPVEFEQSSAPNDKGLISTEALIASRKCKGRLDLNGAIELPDGKTFPRPSVSEHRYPNWEQVLPAEKATFTVALNAKLLFELAQALGTEGVTLRFIDELSPITVTPSFNGQGEHGVMMPMRVGG